MSSEAPALLVYLQEPCGGVPNSLAEAIMGLKTTREPIKDFGAVKLVEVRETLFHQLSCICLSTSLLGQNVELIKKNLLFPL